MNDATWPQRSAQYLGDKGRGGFISQTQAKAVSARGFGHVIFRGIQWSC